MAAEDLVASYGARAFRLAIGMTGNQADAEEDDCSLDEVSAMVDVMSDPLPASARATVTPPDVCRSGALPPTALRIAGNPASQRYVSKVTSEGRGGNTSAGRNGTLGPR